MLHAVNTYMVLPDSQRLTDLGADGAEASGPLPCTLAPYVLPRPYDWKVSRSKVLFFEDALPSNCRSFRLHTTREGSGKQVSELGFEGCPSEGELTLLWGPGRCPDPGSS